MDIHSLDAVVNETVRRIVESVHPIKVILFGSALHGRMGPDSDLDFLIIIPSGGHRRRTAQTIYRHLIGVGFAADIVVVTEDDVEKFGEAPDMVIQPALKEGKVLYAV